MLWQAAHKGLLPQTRELIQELKFKVTSCNSDGKTILHIAAEQGHFLLLQMILKEFTPI